MTALPDRYDPWADADQRPDLNYLLDDALPRGDAWWLPWLKLIVIRRSLPAVVKRCVLAHELVHVDHDDKQVSHVGPDGPRLARRQEHRADQEAAKRLLELRDMAAAMLAHPHSPRAVADELDVTLEVLQRRLHHLRRAEIAWLRAELAGHDHAA